MAREQEVMFPLNVTSSLGPPENSQANIIGFVQQNVQHNGQLFVGLSILSK